MKRCLVCLGLALAGAACTSNTFGNGIGRPPVTPVVRPSLAPVTLAEIYTATSDASRHYVDLLLADDATALDRSGFSLCDSRTCVALSCEPGDCTLEPGARHREMLGDLGLVATAGELGLVDTDGLVHAYLAWGADPSTVGSTLAAQAAVSGATTPGAFIAVPYPMPTTLAVARAGDVEGCVTAEAATPTAPAPCPTAAPVLALTEVLSRLDETGDSWVEIANSGLDALQLYGVRLCQLPSCVVFERDQVIGARGLLLVHLGIAPPDEPLPGEFFFPTFPVLRRSSELALFAPGSAAPADAGLQAFVRFGAAPSELATIAAGAGLWPEPFATAHAVRVAGESLSHDLSADRTDTAWQPATPTPLAENVDIRATTDLWASCSFPRPWRDAAAFELVVYSVQRGASPTILLLNRTNDETAVSLAALSLELDGQSFSLAAAGEVSAGGVLTVQFLPAVDPPTCAEGALCLTGGTLDASGELALVDASGTPVVRQYLRWGDGASAGAAAAVADGVWPLERCKLPPLEADASLTLGNGMSGHAPPDYQ